MALSPYLSCAGSDAPARHPRAVPSALALAAAWGAVLWWSPAARGAETLEELAAENQALRAQVQAQQKMIETLESRMDALEQRTAPASAAAASPASPAALPADPAPPPAAGPPAETIAGSGASAVHLSGEAGFAYFATGDDGAYPTGEFRVDEARLYVDAAAGGDFYFHGEIDPITREATDAEARFGEIYAEAEDLPGGLNLRAGRFNIPFGEEYEYRNVMENSLVTHSLSDVWGFDEGVEGYGAAGPWSYAAALLDGGVNPLNRGHSSLSAAARVGFDPSTVWGLSLSGMRTGWVNAAADTLSAVWFANGFFRALPGASQFDVDLAEIDFHAAWRGGHLRAAAGIAAYRDDGPAGNGRNITYGYIEDVQPLVASLYAALRYSAIAAPKGYPLVGDGTDEDYLFSPVLTTHLERLSLGLGYRFSDPVLLKIDFAPEWGDTLNDGDRSGEQFFGAELAVKF